MWCRCLSRMSLCYKLALSSQPAMFDLELEWTLRGGDRKTKLPSPSPFLPINSCSPSWYSFLFSPQSSPAVKSKDISYNFHLEITEPKITSSFPKMCPGSLNRHGTLLISQCLFFTRVGRNLLHVPWVVLLVGETHLRVLPVKLVFMLGKL